MTCLLNSFFRRLFRIPEASDSEDLFQFEGFPPKVLRKLIDVMESGRDIFNLSLISPILYAQFKQLELRPLSMNLHVSTDKLSVQINFDKERSVSIKILEHTEMAAGQQWQNGSEMVKGTRKFMFCNCPLSSESIVCFVRDPKRSLKPLVEILSRNFPTDAYQHVLIDTDLIRKSVTVFLEHVPVKKCQELVIEGEDATVDKVLVLIKDFNVQKKLTVSDKLIGSAEEFKSLHIPILSLLNAPWLTSDHLINTPHRVIIARATTLNTDELLKFLEWWLFSKNETLKYVILEHKAGLLKYDWFPIVNSMKAVSWNPRYRDGIYVMEEGALPFKLVDCKKGYDFWRRDTLATLVFNENFFGFFIWQDRFPSKTY